MKKISFLALFLVVFLACQLQAAFIVEPHSTGLGFSNFAGTPRYSTTKGTAPGLIATQSAYGSTVNDPFDVYTFSYTPGVNADNWIVPLASRYFGNGEYSTNLAGGQTGYYNVYITWIPTTGITATCKTEVAYDGGIATLTGLNMNTGGTTALAQSLDTDPIAGTVYYGANNAWLRIGTMVHLTAGQTYTVKQTSSDGSWTSMRSAGVMWEFVQVPEPATMLILGLGTFFLRRKN